jgi:hypothetical protein
LERHVKAVHLKQKDYMCNNCFGLFSDSKALQKHNKTNEPNPSILGDPAQCTKYFKVLANLQVQVRHDEERGEFDCLLCVYTSSEQDLTLQHVKEKHRLGATYRCSKCKSWSGTKAKVLLHWDDCNVEEDQKLN